MNIVFIIVVLAVLWLLIEIMSVVLKMTGLDLYKARFQVISILTHTGYTTRESELITQHPLRRRIASVLMVLSYVAQASLITALFQLLTNNARQLATILVLLGALVLFVIVMTRTKYIMSRFNRLVERALSRSIMKQKDQSLDQILKVSPGFGMYEIVLDDSHPLCGLSLMEARLTEEMVYVLKIDRGYKVFDLPGADTVLQSGDRLVLYGKTASIVDITVKKILKTA